MLYSATVPVFGAQIFSLTVTWHGFDVTLASLNYKLLFRKTRTPSWLNNFDPQEGRSQLEGALIFRYKQVYGVDSGERPGIGRLQRFWVTVLPRLLFLPPPLVSWVWEASRVPEVAGRPAV